MIVERAEDLTYDELIRLKAYNERLFNCVKSFTLSGRNGVLCLLGAKETGKRIRIPAKINNVSNRMALKLSLDENIKRKELSRSEISGALKRLYEEWREEKKYIKDTYQGIVGHGDSLRGNMRENSTEYIKNIEEYHPQDLRNPFTISKFVEENNVPLKRKEVTRLIAIDDLPLEVKKELDEGYIDMLTAYELTKFSRGEQLNLYHNLQYF